MRERVAVLVGGDDAVTAALEAAGFAVGGEGTPDVVVLADLVAPVPVPFVELDDEAFEAAWEAPMRRAIDALADARRRLGAGGRVVVVTPPGGPVAHAATVEGIRLLATSAALQWADDGIAVTCVRTPDLVALAATADGLTGATIP